MGRAGRLEVERRQYGQVDEAQGRAVGNPGQRTQAEQRGSRMLSEHTVAVARLLLVETWLPACISAGGPARQPHPFTTPSCARLRVTHTLCMHACRRDRARMVGVTTLAVKLVMMDPCVLAPEVGRSWTARPSAQRYLSTHATTSLVCAIAIAGAVLLGTSAVDASTERLSTMSRILVARCCWLETEHVWAAVLLPHPRCTSRHCRCHCLPVGSIATSTKHD